MQAIIDFLHKARLYAEQNNLGNEEAALTASIRGLNHLTHMDTDLIARWDPLTGKVEDAQENPDGSMVLNLTGPLPGVSKGNLFNPVKLSSHSPTWNDGSVPPKLDPEMLKKAKDFGIGIDPEKANPDEVGAESNYIQAPRAPVAPAKGVTTTEHDLFATPPAEADVAGFASGTQGTRPGPRSPFAPAYQSRSLAEQDGVKLPIPDEVKNRSV